MAKNKELNKSIAKNKSAYSKYFILDKFEAGVVLSGAEVKSSKNGKMNLKDSFVKIINLRPVLINAFINKYSHDTYENYNPKQDRNLLLNKTEIKKIESKLTKGMVIIPTKAYIKNGFIKVEIAVAKAKKQFDKKQTLKEKDIKREVERAKKWES